MSNALEQTDSQSEDGLSNPLLHSEEVRESLRNEVSENLHNEFESRFRESMELAKSQFKQKLEEETARFEEERSRLQQEVAAHRRNAADIAAELVSKQAELDPFNPETAEMLEDPDVELSKLVRNKVSITELSAYVRGLQYLADKM